MSYPAKHSQFLSSDGTHNIITTYWEPSVPPIGVLQIVHGMHEHMERYENFAQYCTEYGFIVWGHDHLGHGLTGMQDDTFGYFGEKQGAKFLVNDSANLTYFLSAQYPDLPIFLLGHSMGSFVTRLQILQVGYLLNGYICMGTGGENPGAPFARTFMQSLIRTSGGKSTSKTAEKIMNDISSQAIGKGEPEDAWISHDPQTVTSYAEDPFTRFQFTNQAYADLLDLMIACNRTEWYQRLDPSLPFFLVSGKEDPISHFGKDVEKIYHNLKDHLILDVEYKLYDQMRHEILNEVQREVVYKDLLAWMIKRM